MKKRRAQKKNERRVKTRKYYLIFTLEGLDKIEWPAAAWSLSVTSCWLQ